MFLVCHMISQNHEIKMPCDFMGSKSLPCDVAKHMQPKGPVMLWVGTTHDKSPPCQVW